MMFTGVDLPCYAINWMFTGGDSQRFLALDEQKTTEHSNPADADAADGYFNEPHFHLMVTTMMMMLT